MKNYLVSAMASTMWADLDKNRFRPEWQSCVIDDLRDLDLICSLTNKGLVAELQKRGIPATLDPKYIRAEYTDTIYLVSTSLNSKELAEYRDSDSLPENTSLKVEKFFVTER